MLQAMAAWVSQVILRAPMFTMVQAVAAVWMAVKLSLILGHLRLWAVLVAVETVLIIQALIQ